MTSSSYLIIDEVISNTSTSLDWYE